MSDFDDCSARAGELTAQAAYAVIKRAAMHIAASMIHGGYDERDRAYSTAHDVEREVGGFIDLVKRSIRMLDHNPERVWVQPVATVYAPAPGGGLPAQKVKSLRLALAEHIAGAYVSGSDDQVRQARLLETALDGLGLNVDNKVDHLVLEQARSLPSARGHGGLLPNLPPF